MTNQGKFIVFYFDEWVKYCASPLAFRFSMDNFAGCEQYQIEENTWIVIK